MLYLSWLLALLLLVEISSSVDVEFNLQHVMSGKFTHPLNSGQPILNGDPLVLYTGTRSDIHMTFEIIDGEWGYLRHIDSGKIFHPKTGQEEAPDGTDVVLHDDLGSWAYFALDQVQHHIVHRDSKKFIHPHTGDANYPPNNDHLVLHKDVHDRMKFKLVSTTNSKEEVFPYGDALITGEWAFVFGVENPLATQTESFTYKLGKSTSESKSGTVQFVWEVEGGAQFYFAHMSTDASLTFDIENSSTETWDEEIIVEDTIEVVAGHPVAVWKKRFIGEQWGHKAVHASNLFAHTNSSHIKPDDYAYTEYRFV